MIHLDSRAFGRLMVVRRRDVERRWAIDLLRRTRRHTESRGTPASRGDRFSSGGEFCDETTALLNIKPTTTTTTTSMSTSATWDDATTGSIRDRCVDLWDVGRWCILCRKNICRLWKQKRSQENASTKNKIATYVFKIPIGISLTFCASLHRHLRWMRNVSFGGTESTGYMFGCHFNIHWFRTIWNVKNWYLRVGHYL